MFIDEASLIVMFGHGTPGMTCGMRVEAFDVAGRKVKTIAMGQYAAGAFDLKWDLRDDGGRRSQRLQGSRRAARLTRESQG